MKGDKIMPEEFQVNHSDRNDLSFQGVCELLKKFDLNNIALLLTTVDSKLGNTADGGEVHNIYELICMLDQKLGDQSQGPTIFNLLQYIGKVLSRVEQSSKENNNDIQGIVQKLESLNKENSEHVAKDLDLHQRLTHLIDERLCISDSKLSAAQNLDNIAALLASVDSKLGETDGKKQSSLYELICMLDQKLGDQSQGPTIFNLLQYIGKALIGVEQSSKENNNDIQGIVQKLESLNKENSEHVAKDLDLHQRLTHLIDERLGTSASKLSAAQNLDNIAALLGSVDSKLGETDGKKRSSLYELMCSFYDRLGESTKGSNISEDLQTTIGAINIIQSDLTSHGNTIQNIEKLIGDLNKYANPPEIYKYAQSTASAVAQLSERIGELGEKHHKDISEMANDLRQTMDDVDRNFKQIFIQHKEFVSTYLEANKQKIGIQTDTIKRHGEIISSLKDEIDEQGKKISSLSDIIKQLNKAHVDLDNSNLMKEYTDATEQVRKQKEILHDTLQKIMSGWQNTFDNLQQVQQKKLDDKISELQRKIDQENASLIELKEKKTNVERDLKAQYHEEVKKFEAHKKKLDELREAQKKWEPEIQRLQEENRTLKAQLEQHGIKPEI